MKGEEKSSLQELIERKREELSRYMYETDWQEFEEGHLINVKPSRWLTTVITEAFEEGRRAERERILAALPNVSYLEVSGGVNSYEDMEKAVLAQVRSIVLTPPTEQ